METCIGVVTHYYNHIGVAVLSLSDTLKLNDLIHVLGYSTDFYQKVSSMEIEHHKVLSAGPGMEVALKVDEVVRRGDEIYLVQE
ncbi:MAG: hypothetical protein HPY59_14315 [Anaerolineae bacterium]|nr:hypothetical protein [Anaerolineae bacterium]